MAEKQCEWAKANLAMRMRVSRDRVVGVIRNHIFGISDPNLTVHHITFMGLQRRLRGVEIKIKVKIGPKMAVFRELRGVNVKFLSSNPEKAHPCAEPRRLTYYRTRENRFRRLGCRLLEEPGKKEAK